MAKNEIYYLGSELIPIHEKMVSIMKIAIGKQLID